MSKTNFNILPLICSKHYESVIIYKQKKTEGTIQLWTIEKHRKHWEQEDTKKHTTQNK
jgi:hypothetical protein